MLSLFSGTMICATFFYIVAIGGCIVLYFNYTTLEGCNTNKIFILINAGLCAILSFFTLLPATQNCKYNRSSADLLLKWYLPCDSTWSNNPDILKPSGLTALSANFLPYKTTDVSGWFWNLALSQIWLSS